MTKEDLLSIIREKIEARKRLKRHPEHVLLRDLYIEYGISEIRLLALELRKDGEIYVGDTNKGRYIKIEEKACS